MRAVRVLADGQIARGGILLHKTHCPSVDLVGQVRDRTFDRRDTRVEVGDIASVLCDVAGVLGNIGGVLGNVGGVLHDVAGVLRNSTCVLRDVARVLRDILVGGVQLRAIDRIGTVGSQPPCCDIGNPHGRAGIA